MFSPCPAEWNEEAFERRRETGTPVSSFVGCQSIGCMRSSKEFDGLNFHLRMMVQIMAVPPTTEAMTMRTVVTVFCICAFLAGTPVAVEDAADTSLVNVTIFGEEGFLEDDATNGAVDVGIGGGVEEVIKGAVVAGGVEVVRGVAATDDTTVGAAVTGLMMLFTTATGVDKGVSNVVGGGGGLDDTTGSLG